MKENIVSFASAVAGGVVSLLYGDVTVIMKILLCMIVIDFVSGVMKAIVEKKLNSEVCSKGIVKKIFILLLVAVGHMVDLAVNSNIVMTAVCFFYIANEGMSIVENAGRMGLPVPEKIKEVLEQLQDRGKEE